MRVNLPEIAQLVKDLRKESETLQDLAAALPDDRRQAECRRAADRALQYSNRLDRAVTT